MSPRLTVNTGGLRGDPFHMFPINTDGSVVSAVDYFLQTYAPVHINPKKEQVGPTDGKPLARRYFALALENAAMFELMVALASASYAARQGHIKEPTRDVLIHYGKGVEALRRKMVKPAGCDDDATILAVMALLGIALIYNDFVSFETHLTGLRHLVDMRGGIDKLGWGGFIRNSITGLESLWAYHENKKLTISTTESSIKIKYPEHPFPPDLCIEIAKLPEGFRELALSATLSLQIIHLLSNVTEWVKQLQLGRKKGVLPIGEPTGTFMQQTHVCLELVGIHQLSVLERAICAAIATLTTETFNKNTQQNPVHRRLIETLSAMLFRYDLSWVPAECTMWLALIIAGPLRSSSGEALLAASPPQTVGDSAEPQRPRDILLDKMVQDLPKARNWKWVEKTVQNFFYNEKLLEAWQQAWEVALLRHTQQEKQKATS